MSEYIYHERFMKWSNKLQRFEECLNIIITDGENAIHKMTVNGEIIRDLKMLLNTIQSSRKASIGSIQNTYTPQLDVIQTNKLISKLFKLEVNNV